MDEYAGNGDANTINAGTVNEATGAAITTINDGDEIDGGAGNDTLNITATADNNTSLTGLTVKNVEVVNITGSDNLAASDTKTDAANSGEAGVITLTSTGAVEIQGKVETIDFRDLTSILGGDIDVSVDAAAAIKVTIGAAKGGADIAKAVADALAAAKTATGGGITGDLGLADSVTVDGSVVTINFKAAAGNISSATSVALTSGSTLTFESTPIFDDIADVQVSTKTASTITNEPVAKLDTHTLTAGTAAGAVELGNNGIEVEVTASQSATSMATAFASAIDGKILDHEVQTIKIPTVTNSAGNGGDLVVGGISVTLADSETAATADDKVVSALNGQVVTLADGTTSIVKASLGESAGWVDLSFPAVEGNVADVNIVQTGITWTSSSATVTESTRGSGVVKAEADSAKVEITYGLAYGSSSDTTTFEFATNAGSNSPANTTAGTAAKVGSNAASIALSNVDVVINGVSTSLGQVTYAATTLAGIAQDDAASKLLAAKEIKAVAATSLDTLLGDGVTIDSSTGDAALTITSNYLGSSLPAISYETGSDDVVIGASTVSTEAEEITSSSKLVAQVLTITDGDSDATSAGTLYIDGKNYGEVGFNDNSDGSSSLVAKLNSVLGAGSAVASVSQTADAVSQIEKIAFSSIDASSTSTLTVSYGDADIVTAALDGTVDGVEIGTLVKEAINALAGADIATVIGSTVVVTGNDAGQDLPAINVVASTTGDVTTAVTELRGSAAPTTSATVVVTAPEAGTPLPNITLSGATVAQTAANIDKLTTTTPADASVSGSQFAGANQIWLVGSDSNDTNLTVSGSQVAGLSKVTGIDGQTYTLGTASTLAISGATTATDKTANVKGGGTTLNIIGTGTSGFSITETNTTDEMDALAVDTSGATVLTVGGLSALETITQAGKGGLTIVDTDLESVYSVTTGEGADKITMDTKTAEDNVATAKDETVNMSVDTGAGDDVLVLTLEGAGNGTAMTGAGNDTIKLNSDSGFSGELTVDAGEGNDTIWLETGFAELSPNVTVDGGSGTNTLALAADDAYVSGDYTKLNSYTSNIDALLFFGAVGSTTAVDVSKLGGIDTFTVTTGTNEFVEVSDGASFTNTAVVRVEDDYLGEFGAYGATAVRITSADYKADTDVEDDEYDAVFGQDVSITHATLSDGPALAALGLNSATTYTVKASDVTLTAVSIGGETAAESAAADIDLKGDMETVTVFLSSARGSGDNAASEYMSQFDIVTDPTTAANAMQNLASITVAGAGVVTIDASDDGDTGTDSTAANLKVINLGGMTDFENLDEDGDPQATDGTYENLSKSTVTLNKEVAETLILGGALDTVKTDSNPDEMDSIQGFTIVATARDDDDADIIDYSVSDVLDILGADYTTADNDADGSAGSSTAFVADETAYVSKDAGLLELAKTSGKKAVFHAEGNTYVFVNDSDTELDSGDVVVELVGIYDLDQLINVIA